MMKKSLISGLIVTSLLTVLSIIWIMEIKFNVDMNREKLRDFLYFIIPIWYTFYLTFFNKDTQE